MKRYFLAAGVGSLLVSLVPAVLAAGVCVVKPSGCPEYEVLNKSFPPGKVTIITRDLSVQQQQWVQNAINALNGSGPAASAGVTFGLSTSRVSGDVGYVSMAFPGNTDTGSAGDTRQYRSPSSPNETQHADVNVYLNTSCSTGSCFDPSQAAAFQAAVQGVIEHELLHTLGLGDTVDPTAQDIMAPFRGMNNSAGTRSLSPCNSSGVSKAKQSRSTGNGGQCVRKP